MSLERSRKTQSVSEDAERAAIRGPNATPNAKQYTQRTEPLSLLVTLCHTFYKKRQKIVTFLPFLSFLGLLF